MVQGVVVADGFIVDTNPATGETLDKVRVSTPDEIEETISQAIAAQPAWALTPLAKRVELLKAAVKLLAPQLESLSTLMTKEMGKTLAEARAEVAGAADKDELMTLIEDANQ